MSSDVAPASAISSDSYNLTSSTSPPYRYTPDKAAHALNKDPPTASFPVVDLLSVNKLQLFNHPFKIGAVPEVLDPIM